MKSSSKNKKRRQAASRILIALGLFLLIVLLTAFISDRIMSAKIRVERADELEADVMVADVEGVQIAYRKMGQKQPVLLLIHGFLGSSYDYHKIMPQLAEHYTVYAVDQIGFGLSDQSTDLDYSKENSARLLAEWMDQLTIKRYHLLGHSMGGEVAMHLALARPEAVEKLILLNSAGLMLPQAGENRNLPDFLIEHVFQNYVLQRLFFYRTVEHRQDASRENFDNFFYFNKQIPAPTLSRIARDNDSGAIADRLDEILQPVQIIWGRKDRIIPLEQGFELNRRLPDSRLIILENCGHLPYLEKPQELVTHLLDFLQNP